MGIVDWVYPKRCVGCGREGKYVCDVCRGKVTTSGESLRYEGAVRKLLKEIKYRGTHDMVSELVELWEEKIGEGVTFSTNVTVTAVPTWWKKMRQRGFNQAELLARELARIRGARYLDMLIRTRETKPMYGLSREERQKNIEGAFGPKTMQRELKSEDVVVLVDDVYTTGATMRECRGVLEKNGVSKVIPLTIAR